MSENRKYPGGFLLLSAVLAVLLAAPFFVKVTTVRGDSMLPTLEDADRLLINKLSYRIGKPERFDIVMFSYHYKPNTYYIKRVIALPGETVRISADGVIYVNGNALVEHYGNAPMQENGLAANEMTLAEDEYFVLGDNRNVSLDSREPDVGNIKERDIVGKASVRLFPFTRFGVIK